MRGPRKAYHEGRGACNIAFATFGVEVLPELKSDNMGDGTPTASQRRLTKVHKAKISMSWLYRDTKESHKFHCPV